MKSLKKVAATIVLSIMCLLSLDTFSVKSYAATPSYKDGVKYINIDYDDIVMLERIVIAEAGNQDLDAKKAVCTVVINRCLSPEFPDTVYDVIHQKKTTVDGKTVYQFSSVMDGNYDKAEGRESEAEAAVLSALQEFADGEAMLPRNVLYFRSGYYFDWPTVKDYACYDNMYFSELVEV